MFLIPLATWSYTFLMILCAIFGITFGSSFSFTPMITSRLVDMDDFTLAYGLILLVQGLGSLIGPPLAGAIYQVTNRWVLLLPAVLRFLTIIHWYSWHDSFYAGGICVALSGFFAYIIGSLRVESDNDEDENNNYEVNNDETKSQLKWAHGNSVIGGEKLINYLNIAWNN